MNQGVNRQWLLAARPEGMVEPSHFELRESPLPEPAEGEFLVVDPAFNALWAWSELALAEIARNLGRDSRGHLAEAARITAALVDQLWSESRSLFLARDERSDRLLPERTVAGLIPLILPGLPGHHVSALY